MDVVPVVDPDGLDDASLVQQLLAMGLIAEENAAAGADAWPLLLAPYRADLLVEGRWSTAVKTNGGVVVVVVVVVVFVVFVVFVFVFFFDDAALDCPVTAFTAADDATLPPGTTMESWRDTTKGPFELVTVEEGLFIDDAPDERIWQRILGALGAECWAVAAAAMAWRESSRAERRSCFVSASAAKEEQWLDVLLDVREGAFRRKWSRGSRGPFTRCWRVVAATARLRRWEICPSAPLVLRTEKRSRIRDCSMTHSSPEPSTTVTPSQSCPGVALSYAELEEKSR